MRALAAARFCNTFRRRRAVMAVGDIERGQDVDGARERRNRGIVADHPELMAHAVIGGDVDRGLACGGARQQGIDVRRRRISEHDRAGLRIHRFDLADAIVFLGNRRQFVLADAIAGVGADRRHRGEAGLDVTAPGQPVDIVTGLVVAPEHAGADHALQILGGLGVDRVVVRIDRRIEVDLRLGDVQETPRLALGALVRLGARQHVIGRRQNFGGAPWRRPQRAEGLYQAQVLSPLRESQLYNIAGTKPLDGGRDQIPRACIFGQFVVGNTRIASSCYRDVLLIAEILVGGNEDVKLLLGGAE